MDRNMKEVYFEQYCNTCTNKNTKATDDPCNECLTECAREDSHKPIRYVKEMKMKKKK